MAKAGEKRTTKARCFRSFFTYNSIRAVAKAGFDTPLRSSSASQSGIEQTHDEVDPRILEELTGRVHDDVGGFYERYFEGKFWTNNARDIYEESRAQYVEGRWSGWPEP